MPMVEIDDRQMIGARETRRPENRRPWIEFDPEEIYNEYEARSMRAKRARKYRISREANALTTALFGIGILMFVISLTTGLLSVPHGFLAWIAAWVLVFALRSYLVTVVYDDTGDHEPQF